MILKLMQIKKKVLKKINKKENHSNLPHQIVAQIKNKTR